MEEYIRKIITESLFGFITSGLVSLMMLIFHKWIFLGIKKYFKKLYNKIFILPIAKKGRNSSLSTMLFLTIFLIIIYTILRLGSFKADFEKNKVELLTYKVLNDSVYVRLRENKISKTTYEGEINEIERLKIHKRDAGKLDLSSKTLKDKEILNVLNNQLFILEIILIIGQSFIWGILLYATSLFSINQERIRMMNDFDWKIQKTEISFLVKKLFFCRQSGQP